MSVITVQCYELFVVIVSFTYFGAIQTLSRSITVQELVRGVSLVTVSCDVICSGDVSCDGAIKRGRGWARLINWRVTS